ncbi:hypothetical protein ADUPG1_012051 [Aduncisulcus paluster]|uniref:Uncharacterized protein n=1 Tax=Aduncisulcus paluster TaxID=2918883 RepID=A0ABQ5JYT8_9EUKA|nr:hypothetical protein ADUPG1_012051 [Aduncisulcus paluster]
MSNAASLERLRLLKRFSSQELKVVFARSLAYGNALNRQSYELRCSAVSLSVAMTLQKLSATTVSYFLLLTVRVLYRSAAHTPPIPFSESMCLSLTSPTPMCQLSSKLR